MTHHPPLRPHLVAFETGSFVRPVLRFAWSPVPAPVPDAGADPISRLLVVGADPQLTRLVAEQLRAWCPVVDAATGADEPPPGNWQAIVDLNLTGVRYSPGENDWRDALARTTRLLQHRYGDWRAEPRAGHHRYLAVTQMGGQMGYAGDDLPQPLGGVWAGLAKTLSRELPNLAVKVLDSDTVDPAELARRIRTELHAPDQFEIGYRDGRRYTLEARRAPTPVPSLDLGPDDTVLISGGARGVGFALARGLAGRFGCRVVVTGRGRLPTDADWYREGDDAYDRRRRARIAAAGSADGLRRLRTALRRESELRVIGANLAGAVGHGLRIEYRACDVTMPAEVERLFGELPAPSVIVHNAGIDEPRRFDEKSPDEVVRTVEVKVTGFANLVTAVLADPGRRAALRLFCNVGSLAGRLGGMIGQADYAAGNEALARLGFWAAARHGLPVQTICWPTWDRLGVIANYDAAVRYVSTIAPDEGVRRWIDEIRGGRTGEAMFIGRIGAAIAPAMLRGFWRFTGHPDLPRLHGLAHALGEVAEYEPFRRLATVVTHEPGRHPALAEFRVGGQPALPVSMLVEQACGVGDWVTPPGWPRQHLVELRDLRVYLPGLRLAPTGGRFRIEAAGEQVGAEWRVTVAVGSVARMVLVYRPEPTAAWPEPVRPADHTVAGPAAAAVGGPATAAVGGPATAAVGGQAAAAVAGPAAATAAGSVLEWSWLAIQPPRWDGDGRAVLAPVTAADLWCLPFAPTPGIAPAAIEAAVQAVVHRDPTGETLLLDRMLLRPGAQHVDTLASGATAGDWTGSVAGEPVVRIDGLRAGDRG